MGRCLELSDFRDVFSGTYFMDSMRNSGYNTNYALAELIDNSVEAGAKHIEVMFGDKKNYSGKKTTNQINCIAIADDGVGMSEVELWNSLLMGQGTRQHTGKIGKFGMGLPNASISQCKKVTVYSWKDPDNVFSTYLDLDAPIDNKIVAPKPTKDQLPEIWKNKSRYLSTAKSGTLVVWAKIDKSSWKKSSTIINNSIRMVGRTYRKFIHNDKLKIDLIAFDIDTTKTEMEEPVLPNDPLYQMIPSSTPPPWNKKKLFQADGDSLVTPYDVEGYEVKVRYAYVVNEGRQLTDTGLQAGRQDHGKHANSNLGVSLIRADRELYLDTNLCQTYDPIERWWGVEVEFPVELDEIFGVTNDKQNAVHFSSITKKLGARSRKEEGDDNEGNDEDDDEPLFDLVTKIHARIRTMRTAIKAIKTDPTRPDPPPPPIPDDDTTVTGNQRDTLSEKDRLDELMKILSEYGEDPTQAKDLIKQNTKYKIQKHPLNSPHFFEVSLKGGVMFITLNMNHPIYDYLIKAYDTLPNDLSIEDAKKRLHDVRSSIFAIIYSWAYLENHEASDDKRDEIGHIRYMWGKHIKEILKRTIEAPDRQK